MCSVLNPPSCIQDSSLPPPGTSPGMPGTGGEVKMIQLDGQMSNKREHASIMQLCKSDCYI